jgi:hypothetical protein
MQRTRPGVFSLEAAWSVGVYCVREADNLSDNTNHPFRPDEFELIRASVFFAAYAAAPFASRACSSEAGVSASAGHSMRISRPQAVQTKSRVSLRKRCPQTQSKQ